MTLEELAAVIPDAQRIALDRAPAVVRDSPRYRERIRRACAEAVMEKVRGCA